MDTSYPHFEVIIADNASTDGTAEWLRNRWPEVKHIRHPQNWLFCKGNNEAIKYVTGKYILLLNNDVQVAPGWLTPLVATIEKKPGVAAVQPKMLQMDGRHFEYAGAAGGFVDSLGYPFAQGRLFDTLERDEGQYDNCTDIFWASGAAILLDRDAFDKVGGLDEHFEMHMEEVDLCWRLHRSGYRVEVEPNSNVRHLGGSSLPSADPQKTYYNFRNSLLMLYKNTPASYWPQIFAKRVIFDIAAASRFSFNGRISHVSAISCAYRDAYTMRDFYAQNRPSKEAYYPLPYQGCIAYDYFLRQRTTCLDLPAVLFRPPFERRPPSSAGG